MKKLCLVFALILTLSACGKPAVSQSTADLPVQNKNEIIPLSQFDGKGIYKLEAVDSANPQIYLTYIDGETAAQVPLCNTPSCLHNNVDCTAVFNTLGRLYSYDGKLIYFSDGNSSGYNSEVQYSTIIEPPSIIMADATGGNRKTLGAINGEFFGSFPEAVYGDNLIFATMAEDGTLINSMNMQTGDIQQLSENVIPYAGEYLGYYKNNIIYMTFEYIADSMKHQIYLLNAENKTVKCIYELSAPYKPESDTNESVYYKYYNNKVYEFTDGSANGMDTLKSIDCETGKIDLICDDILNESYFNQYIHNIVNDVLIIDSPQKGDDKSLPAIRRFTVNLNTKEKGEINLVSKDPVKGTIYTVEIFSHMGDNLLVTHNKKYETQILNDLEGNPVETETLKAELAIISKSDYLSSTPNFKTVTK